MIEDYDQVIDRDQASLDALLEWSAQHECRRCGLEDWQTELYPVDDHTDRYMACSGCLLTLGDTPPPMIPF